MKKTTVWTSRNSQPVKKKTTPARLRGYFYSGIFRFRLSMPVTGGLAGQHGGHLKSQLARKNFIYRAPRDGEAPRSIGTGARSVSTCALGRDGCAYRLDKTRVDREGEVD